MIKKIFLLIIAFVITVAAVVNFNMSSKKHDMTDVMLSSIEALAQGENSTYFENRKDIFNGYFQCFFQCMEESNDLCAYWMGWDMQC